MSEDPTKRQDWHVITRTRGGTVSILKNLDLRTAIEARKRVPPVWEGRGPGMFACNDGDIEMSTIIGPDGWDGCSAALKHSYGEPYYGTEEYSGERFVFTRATCAHCGAAKSLKFDREPASLHEKTGNPGETR